MNRGSEGSPDISHESIGLTLVRLACGSGAHMSLWHQLLWESYLDAGQPFGVTEADCLRWWEAQVNAEDSLLPDPQ